MFDMILLYSAFRGKGYFLSVFIFSLALSSSFLSDTLFSSELRGRRLRHHDELLEEIKNDMPAPPEVPLPPEDEYINAFRPFISKGTSGEAERVTWILGDWPGEKNIELLMAALRHQSTRVNAMAARSAVKLQEYLYGDTLDEVMKELLQFLNEEELIVKASALKAFGGLGAKDYAGVVRDYALSADPTVASAALSALRHLGDHQSADVVLERLGDENLLVAKSAVEASTAMPADKTLEPLLNLLDSPPAIIRNRVLWALNEMNADVGADAIIPLLDDDVGTVRRQALLTMDGLGFVSDHSELMGSIFEDPDSTVRITVAGLARKHHMDQYVPHLFDLLEDHHYYVREEAAVALAAIGNDEVIELAANGLESEHGTVRAGSSQILGRLQSSRNFEAHPGLLTDSYVPAQEWAAWALGEIGMEDAGPELHAIAFPDESVDVSLDARISAVLSMGKVGYEGAFDEFVHIIPQKPTETSPGQPEMLRRAAIRAIGLLESEEHKRVLLSRLNDGGADVDDPELSGVRREAAFGLARIGGRDIAENLESQLTSENPYRLKYICKWGIYKITGEPYEYEITLPDPPRPTYFIRRLN